MKKVYDIGIKKTTYGFRQVRAESEEEAKASIQEEINEEEIDFVEEDSVTEIISTDDLNEN